MRYRVGRRTKFYRLRRIGFRGRIALLLAGVLLSNVITVELLPTVAPGLVSFAQKYAPGASPRGGAVLGSIKKGSSKAPPKGTSAMSNQIGSNATGPVRSVGCAVFPAAHPGLTGSSAPELRKLAQYEQLCGGAVAARSSFFVPTPATVAEAQASAHDIADTLKAYAQAGMAPLVFMEPNSLEGANLDLSQYAKGTYDSALDAYFGGLQSAGVTSGMMGMWVFVPEGNLPVWSTVDPAVYAAVVAKTAQFQKKYFPASQASLMLDSESYPINGSWGDGRYVSLVPYVQNIPKGLIDSFGLQGFPWAAPANQPASVSYDPKSYLRVDFAAEAAKALGVTNVWLNTGTFNQMYAKQPSQTITLAPSQRQAMLNGVLQQAQQVKSQGFTVAVHLFAQNKASLDEATDWSYWQKQPDTSANTSVFKTFAHDAAAAGLPIWLYDTE